MRDDLKIKGFLQHKNMEAILAESFGGVGCRILIEKD